MNWQERYPWAERCARHPDEYFERLSRPREEWGPGPWAEEPDVVDWQTAHGLRGFLARSLSAGSFCGYVGLPEGHPFYGKAYWQLEIPLEVHGGLSFAGFLEGEGTGIAPEHLRLWWLGFDTAHAYDLSPAFLASLRDLRHPRHWARLAAEGLSAPPPLPSFFESGQYWTVERMRTEVEGLAAQCKAASNPGVLEALRSALETNAEPSTMPAPHADRDVTPDGQRGGS